MNTLKTVKDYTELLNNIDNSTETLIETNISHFKGSSSLHDVIPTTTMRKARNPAVTLPHNQKTKAVTVISNQKQITNYVTRNSKEGNLVATDKGKVVASLKNLKKIAQHAKNAQATSKERSDALNNFEKKIKQTSGSHASNIEIKTTK